MKLLIVLATMFLVVGLYILMISKMDEKKLNEFFKNMSKYHKDMWFWH